MCVCSYLNIMCAECSTHVFNLFLYVFLRVSCAFTAEKKRKKNMYLRAWGKKWYVWTLINWWVCVTNCVQDCLPLTISDNLKSWEFLVWALQVISNILFQQNDLSMYTHHSLCKWSCDIENDCYILVLNTKLVQSKP